MGLTQCPVDCTQVLCGNKTDLLSHWPCIVICSCSIVPLSCRDWYIVPLTVCRSSATTSLTYCPIDCILCCMATGLTYHPIDCAQVLCGNKIDLSSHWPCTYAVWQEDWPIIPLTMYRCCVATRLTYHPIDRVQVLCGNKIDLSSHWLCTGAVRQQDWPDGWAEGVSGTGPAIGWQSRRALLRDLGQDGRECDQTVPGTRQDHPKDWHRLQGVCVCVWGDL